jgi:hypothetical protein
LIEKIITILLGELFKKKPWALWGIKQNEKKWTKIGTGSMRRLRLYEKTLFAEGWRTLICAIGITPFPPPVISNLSNDVKDSIGE